MDISRARDRADLVTDDKGALKDRLEAVFGERIAAVEVVMSVREQGRAPKGVEASWGCSRRDGIQRSSGSACGSRRRAR